MRPDAVDEVEERQLAHLAAREHAPGEAALLGRLRPGLERLGLGADGGDLVAVGEALRRSRAGRLDAARRRIIQACGPSSGVRPSRTTSKPCPA